MKTITALLEKSRARFFGTEDDDTWKNWVNLKKQEWSDLNAIIVSDARRPFKERAIFILLVPFWKWIPFYWKKSSDYYKRRCNREFIKILPPELVEYTVDLVRDFYEAIIEMGEPNKHSGVLYFYSLCILDLLPLLSEEKADELFKYYQLIDPLPFTGMDDASGYNFFRHLIYSDIDIKWKRMADTQIRQIIRDEAEGKSKPRSDLGQVIKCYFNLIEYNLYDKQWPYDVDLFASQIGFIIDNTGNAKYCLIQSYNLDKYFKLFSGVKYRELRRRIARYVILYKGEEFIINSEELMRTSEMIMEEFGEIELKLATILKPAIKKGKELLIKRGEEARAKENHARHVYARMR